MVQKYRNHVMNTGIPYSTGTIFQQITGNHKSSKKMFLSVKDEYEPRQREFV
jgi:hypothetical protein